MTNTDQPFNVKRRMKAQRPGDGSTRPRYAAESSDRCSASVAGHLDRLKSGSATLTEGECHEWPAYRHPGGHNEDNRAWSAEELVRRTSTGPSRAAGRTRR